MSYSDNNASAKDCRSALYMPASNLRALQKGAALSADAIIMDLEDSVSPDQKSLAREQAVAALTDNDYGHRLRAVRINTSDTQWHHDDIAAVVAAKPNVIVLPKVESSQDLLSVRDQIDQHVGMQDIQLWAMIETPSALLNAQDIASCNASGISALLIGNNDMARASNMPVTSDRTYLIPWLMQLVAVAHANSLALFDGVYNNFKDMSGFESECKQGVAMGMTGKTLIHPSQISVVNTVFSPTEVDIDNARSIVHAFSQPENLTAGVLQINGRMVERLHLEMAEQLLARVERLSHR